MAPVKKTAQDFKLISNITKARIKGLIEKRLTTQTIALFAQEYENYDEAVRNEITAFILFLLENEEYELNLRFGEDQEHRNQYLYNRKKQEFDEKKANFLKIQKMLSDDIKNNNVGIKAQKQNNIKFDNDQKKYDFFSAQDVKKANADSTTKKTSKDVNPNINKLIKDAEERERRLKKEEETQKRLAEKERLRAEAEKRKLAEQKAADEKRKKELEQEKLKKANEALAEQAIKKAEMKKQAAAKAALREQLKKEQEIKKQAALRKKEQEAAEMADKKATAAAIKAEKQKAARAAKIAEEERKKAEKEIKISEAARDYEKEQREKEKLWLQLYGKSREESLKERSVLKASEFVASLNSDKRPTFEFEIEATDFKIENNVYLVDEVTNPKNRCYLFWNDIKLKYGVPSIYVLIKDKPPKLLKKVNRKRKAFEKKLRRKGGTVPKAETIKKLAALKTKTDVKNVKFTEKKVSASTPAED